MSPTRCKVITPPGFRFVSSPALADDRYPSLQYTTTEGGAPADVTVVTYGGLTDLAEEAMEALILDRELEFDYFILSQLNPLHLEDVVESVRRTGRLVTVEEGPAAFGVGAEIMAQVAEALGKDGVRARRVASLDLPIPSARGQEREVLPSRERIVAAIREVS